MAHDDLQTPLVSVVLTLMHPRGRALESIASWTRGQTLARERIALIVVSNGADPHLEAAVRVGLGPHDQFVQRSAPNELELYDQGARLARSTWILFTEPHVIADPHCLAALLHHVEEYGLDGACVRTLPTQESQWVAQIEARMYLEDAATWTDAGDWRKFTKRGTMLRRVAYKAVGGLDHRYGYYAETAIAARLHAQGFRLGYAPEATITHYNSVELGELLTYVWEYCQEGCAFQEDYPELIPGAGQPGRAVPGRLVRKISSRCAGSTLRSALGRLGTRSGRKLAWTMLRWQLRSWLMRQLGPSWDHTLAHLRYISARLWLAWTPANTDPCYRAFRRVWERLGEYAASDYLLRCSARQRAQGPRTPTVLRPPCRPGELPDSALVGFHARENWNGQSFRWTSPVASLLLDIAPGDWVVLLETRGVRCPSFDDVRLFWNGNAAVPDLACTGDGWLAFRIERPLFTAPGPQLLTLTCSRLGGGSHEERRALGLPLFAVEFQEATSKGVRQSAMPSAAFCPG